MLTEQLGLTRISEVEHVVLLRRFPFTIENSVQRFRCVYNV